MEIIRSWGLNVFLERSAVRQRTVWESVTPPGHWIGMLLEGDIAVQQTAFGEGRWSGGRATVFSTDQDMATRHVALKDGYVSAVFVQVEGAAAETLIGADTLARIARCKPEAGMLLPDLVRAIAWQMIGCSFSGNTRRLWMTGKAMEMVAHVVDLVSPGGTGGTGTSLSARDIARVQEARDILLTELKMPPSVPDLARRVGTNARSLGEGFQTLFGSSVYGFVKTQRLETARALLEAGETSVKSVAREVGYQPQHLATEFRRRFGLTPTEVLAKPR